MLYEFHFLKKVCQKRPAQRQWFIRDSLLDLDPGFVEMSPSMQAAFMRVMHSKEKGLVRAAIREIVPIILYRQTERHQQTVAGKEDAGGGAGMTDLIPDSEPATLNAKKRELYERKDSVTAFQETRLIDERSQNRLRWKIRLRLIRFQKQMAQQNAVATRSVLYSEMDAIGYFAFRAAPMYAVMHRVYYELCKMLPHFIPKTMLDFGSGSGTAILCAKETWDPDGLALPLDRETKRTMKPLVSSVADSSNSSGSGTTSVTSSSSASVASDWSLKELRVDLERMSKTNAARRRARFIAVAGLIARGEVKLAEVPKDLRREIVAAARVAAANAEERQRIEVLGRLKKFVNTATVDWEKGADEIEQQLRDVDPNAPETAAKDAAVEDEEEFHNAGVKGDDDDLDAEFSGRSDGSKSKNKKTWWEQYVDDEFSAKQSAARRRLRPLQSIVAIEPSPGMIDTAMNVLQDDVPNVSYQRYLNPDDATQYDLVTCAYSLSEIASKAERARHVQELWKRTRGVLVLVEYANLPNFNIMMEARDTILAEKDAGGLWDWQPTIIGPCPHEKRCPIRHSAFGVKRKAFRICKSEAAYRPTFVEHWVHQYGPRDPKRRRTDEPFCYLIVARNEIVPERAERRVEQQRKEEQRMQRQRDAQHKEMLKRALRVKEEVFSDGGAQLSEEVLSRPISSSSSTDPLAASDVIASEIPTTSRSLLSNPASVSDAQAEAALNNNNDNNNIGEGKSTSLAFGKHEPEYINNNSSTGVRTRYAFPEIFPIATHRYNRAPYIGTDHQIQRIISPTEMLVVRRDVASMQARYLNRMHRYWRVVLTHPRCAGKITAHFCTGEGDLVRARVYRRFFGRGDHHVHNAKGVVPGGFPAWQYMGGWRALKRARLCSVFPSEDVPLYSVRKMAQVDFSNTLLNHKMSVVEQTAMQHNVGWDSSKRENDEDAENKHKQGGGDDDDASDAFAGGRATPAFARLREAAAKSGTSDELAYGSSTSSSSSNQQKKKQQSDMGSSSSSEHNDGGDSSSVEWDPEASMLQRSEEALKTVTNMLNRGNITPDQVVDSRSPISGMQWVRAVQNARRRVKNSASLGGRRASTSRR